MCRRERVVRSTSDVQVQTERRGLCRRKKDWMTAEWRRVDRKDPSQYQDVVVCDGQ